MGFASLPKRIIQKLKLWVIDKPIPPATQREMALIKDLKDEFDMLRNDLAQANQEWSQYTNRLSELVADDDVRSFLRWDVIQESMFVGNEPYIKDELDYFGNLTDWKSKWSEAIVESPVGHPIPCVFYPDSSGNLIHHAYHLAQFEEKIGIKIDEISFVFEFGGGYGSMCRLFYNLGFSGDYVIFDLPPFSVMQRFYLRTLSLPVLQMSSVSENHAGIVSLSDMADLEKVLSSSRIRKGSRSLFLATWSLSEAPTELRDAIVSMISDFDMVLIAYQSSYAGVDNVQFFDNFRHHFTGMIWHNWEIGHLGGNWYLMGSSASW